MKRALPLLERAVARANSPISAAERPAHIARITDPRRRLQATVIQKLMPIARPVLSATMDHITARAEVAYISSGAEATVYRRGDTVQKVIRTTYGRPLTEQSQVMAEKSHDFSIMQRHLGNFMLDQSFGIAPHPLARPTVVQIKQQYLDFQALNLFSSNRTEIDTANLEYLTIKLPGIDSALNDFVDQSFHMLAETDYVPDTNGVDNLVLSQAGNLILIDTQPIGKQHPEVQSTIQSQLQSLRLGLLAVSV